MRDTEVTEETKVIFRKVYEPDAKAWYVVAFFPGATAYPGNIQCYEHIGQHCEACLEYYWDSRKCAPEEYEDLKNELEGCFGYRFRVVRKLTRMDREGAWEWARELARKERGEK